MRAMRLLPLLCCLLAAAAFAKGRAPSAKGPKEKPTLSFRPAEGDGDERPLVSEVLAGPQGSDFAFRISFTKVPWGEECANRCANATLFVDTDNSRTTGLQVGTDAPETGADLAVTVQGVREYKESSAESRLRVRVRFLGSGHSSLEQGDTLAELDLRTDKDRVQVDGSVVSLLIDATAATLPSGRVARVVYHPPGAKAVHGTTAGMLAGGKRRIVQLGTR